MHFTVFGNPISHSLSPQIHVAFAKQHHLDIRYTRSLTSPGQFRRAVRDFFYSGGAGANVTVPFKEQAYQLVTHLSERAAIAGAVNTLVPLGYGQLLGDNTDGIGLLHDLRHNLKENLTGRQIVIVGAGGAARGAVYPLLQAGAEHITIANRTVQKAQDLSALFADNRVSACGLSELKVVKGALVINATSASLSGASLALSAAQLSQASSAYDMMYSEQPTAFMQQATAAGVQAVYDGLGMLVEQAAVAFRLWHNVVELDTQAVIRQLRGG